jgi:hypothetical protein
MSRWHTMWDDGETICRRTRLAGHTWRVYTDPAETRWFEADGAGSIIRGHTGWEAYSFRPYRQLVQGVTFRQAIDALTRHTPTPAL